MKFLDLFAGNSVTVNVIEAIARKLEETDEYTGSETKIT